MNDKHNIFGWKASGRKMRGSEFYEISQPWKYIPSAQSCERLNYMSVEADGF